MDRWAFRLVERDDGAVSMAAGSERCCVYADVANVASNTIYERLGYVPVCEVTRDTFDA